jgi:hypothetical protein
MSRKMIETNKDLHRAKKTVLTIEEMQKLDPGYVPPYIPAKGEPDI